MQHDAARHPISPQHTTSFEQLRQLVTAISPNSKPRRRRAALAQQYSETVEQEEENGDLTNRERDRSFDTVSRLRQKLGR